MCPPSQNGTYACDDEPAIVATDGVGAPLPLDRPLLGAPLATDVTARYEVDPSAVLGRGTFATARACVDRASGRRLACKSIVKRRLQGVNERAMDARREAQIMHHLAGHPNVARLVGAYEDPSYVHLVMELAEGGSLLDRVMEQGPLPEREAAGVARALLELVAYAHELGVTHRDIKLDNLLWADASQGAGALRLIDWGCSAWVPRGAGGKLDGLCGTSFYIAPEVLGGVYDERADVWSCGVVLYVLLCGRPPFSGSRTEAIFRRILDDGVPDMCGGVWPSVSDAAKEAVRRMMTYFPGRRPGAREMLQHEWLRGGGGGGGEAAAAANREPELLARVRSFAAQSAEARLSKLAAAAQLQPDQTHGLRLVFAAMAGANGGALDAAALQQALAQQGCQLPAGEAASLVAAADLDGDGQLSLAEFLAATVHPSILGACHADSTAAADASAAAAGAGAGRPRSPCRADKAAAPRPLTPVAADAAASDAAGAADQGSGSTGTASGGSDQSVQATSTTTSLGSGAGEARAGDSDSAGTPGASCAPSAAALLGGAPGPCACPAAGCAGGAAPAACGFGVGPLEPAVAVSLGAR